MALPITHPAAPLLKEDHKSFRKNALQTVWDEMLAEYEANKSEAFEYRTKPSSDKFCFISSSETQGSGCCGIIPISNFRFLCPSKDYSTGPGVVQWDKFRSEIKHLFYGVMVVDKGSGVGQTGKMFMVSLTEGTLKAWPHLVEILEFLNFKQTDMCFRNITTANVVVVFVRIPDKAKRTPAKKYVKD